MPKVRSGSSVPSVSNLARFARAGKMREFLEFYAFRSNFFFIDDFNGDAINLDYWAVANSSGTSAADFAVNITSGAAAGTGVIQSDSGTSDNGSTSLVGPIIYKGDKNCGMWCRFNVDDVTDWEFEVGFVDAVPGSDGPAFSAVAPTAVAADAAVLHADTDEASAALDKPHFLTVGSTSNQDAKATSTGFTPVNATYMDVVIQLIGNDAYCILNNGVASVSHHNGLSGNAAGHVEGGVALAPWVYNRTRSTTAKFMNVDAIAIWSDR